jgi:hypothetical protein
MKEITNEYVIHLTNFLINFKKSICQLKNNKINKNVYIIKENNKIIIEINKKRK